MFNSKLWGRCNLSTRGLRRRGRIFPSAIPPGVGHGYKVVGTEPALLVYATDQYYNPADEGRLAWNDPDVNYDWETQKK